MTPVTVSSTTSDVPTGVGSICDWSSMSQLSPHLKKLLRLIMSPDFNFYTEIDRAIVNVLITYNSMTELGLKSHTRLDNQSLKSAIQGLVKDKILKIRQAGDANDRNVGMGHIYVNYEDLRNHARYILNAIRRKIHEQEKEYNSFRRWARKETWFRCTNEFCGQVKGQLYVSEVRCSTTNIFKCNFCKHRVEAYDVDHPETVTLEEFNSTFGKMYKLLQKIDAYRPPPVNGVSTPAQMGRRMGLRVEVRFVDDSKENETPTSKEMPPWFLRSNN